MNEVYSYTGELINYHFERHIQSREPRLRITIEPLLNCPLCFIPTEENTPQFLNFWKWIQPKGATTYSQVTQQIFLQLSESDLEDTTRIEFQRKAIRLLNTLIYREYFIVNDQVRLLESFTAQTIRTGLFAQNIRPVTLEIEDQQTINNNIEPEQQE